MGKQAVLFIFVILLSWISGCEESSISGCEESSLGSISGTVNHFDLFYTEQNITQPFKEIKLAVKSRGTQTDPIYTCSGQDGSFHFYSLPEGEYDLYLFLPDGYRFVTTEESNLHRKDVDFDKPYMESVSVNGGKTTTLNPFDLKVVWFPVDTDATVVFQVKNSHTNLPVTNATVLCGSAVTSNGGSDGRYTLSVPVVVPDPDTPTDEVNLEAGTSYSIQATDYETLTGKVLLSPSVLTEVPVLLDSIVKQ